jgi:hypothetical protein
MKRADRKRWKAARSLADVGELTVAWLRGELAETPGYGGPPDPETVPHVPVLAAVNRTGFVTDNSQSASSAADARQWNAWVCGLIGDAGWARLAAAIDGTPLVVEARCRGREHHGHRGGWLRCPRRDVVGLYADRCPGAAAEIRAAWHVVLADPEPGRNDRLWPALERFAVT